MNNALQASIRRQVADHDVRHIQLWFTDHMGELEMVEIPGSRIDSLLSKGALPNDSSTTGLGVSAGADIVAVPDWSTFRVVPGTPERGRIARVFCNLTSLGFCAGEFAFA